MCFNNESTALNLPLPKQYACNGKHAFISFCMHTHIIHTPHNAGMCQHIGAYDVAR